ncbi:MAG: hypothetical protein EKK54_04380 [Neisseriaceae bacterium]|nr:MAG: hypothetical protein EKK54_04380 [Neisseriaceae bacterium]
MPKINEEIFDAVANNATLKDSRNQLSEDNEIQRYVMVYDIPKAWLRALRANRITASSYLKQAFREKLQRDKIL